MSGTAVNRAFLPPRKIPPTQLPSNLATWIFPNSCKPEAQPALLKGLALLHSFQYRESESAFKAGTDLDTNCAIAHWGAAMALYHQLWDFPGKRTLKEGLKSVEEAQKLGAPTPRERGYIAAAAAFYQDDEKLSHVQRTTAYSEALSAITFRLARGYRSQRVLCLVAGGFGG